MHFTDLIDAANNYDGHAFRGDGPTCSTCGLSPLLHNNNGWRPHGHACTNVKHNHVSCIVAKIATGFPREEWCAACLDYYKENA